MKKQFRMMALLALSAALVACGGDDEETPPSTGGTGGDTDAGGSGGSGGSTGGTGGATGGTGGGMAAMPVECGTATCQPPENPLSQFAGLLGGGMMLPATAYACCRDEATGACGFSPTADGAVCNEPAVEDMRCDDFMLPEIMLGPIMIPEINLGYGCCINNQCGVDGSLFGNGCTENGAAVEMLGGQMFGEFLVDGIPAPRACDAPPPDDGGTDDDAGN